MGHREYSLMELLDRIGTDYRLQSESVGKTDCINPACGKRKKMNLNFSDNYFRCPVCNLSGGVLHFYSYVVLNEELEKGSSSKVLGQVAKKLAEFMGDETSAAPAAEASKPKVPTVPVASDDALNAAYNVILDIPALQLLPEHKRNLMKRGLSEDAILRNGYRSIPKVMDVDQLYREMYENHGGEMRRRNTMGWLSKEQICFGLMVAKHLTSRGISPRGVPGFFKFGELWCFWCNPGILIPTRNMSGQIVIFQVRSDIVKKGEPRYKTCSSKSLPNHVTDSVSRCHFPLSNSPISGKVPLILTEGPLKADVASCLYGSPAAFAAIPGITTTNDLFRCCNRFIELGVNTVLNGTDMDRLTNPNVRNGVEMIRKKLSDLKLSFRDLYWDKQYAISKFLILSTIARKQKIAVPEVRGNIFEQLNAVAVALNDCEIDACKLRTGRSVCEYYWNSETKGIDDYLLNRSADRL